MIELDELVGTRRGEMMAATADSVICACPALILECQAFEQGYSDNCGSTLSENR